MEKLKKKVTIVLMALMMTMVFFADAQAKAEEILAQAQIQTNELVSEHQIMQQAYAQANEVVSIATNQAQEILYCSRSFRP